MSTVRGKRAGKGPRRLNALKPRAATLRDVAKAAGVSAMTVSNVVNGHFKLVLPETRARVERAIRDLVYRPHAIARSLRQARSLTIGLLILDETRSFLADPFITQITAGLSATLGEQGYGLLLHGVPTDQVEDIVFLRDARTDGICLFLSGTEKRRREVISMIAQLDEPIVIFQEISIPLINDCCIVRQADFEGGRVLAKHLLERGAQRIVILGPDITWPGATQRLAGMQHALSEAKPPITPRLVRCRDLNPGAVETALENYIAEYGMPDAILTINDRMGISALKVLQNGGYQVPGDVKVTGYNALDVWQYSHPVLTTIESQAYAMGQVAAKAMMERLETGTFGTEEIVLPVRLRVGEST